MAGLHLMPGKPVWVHEADVEAARSWQGLSRHYGYPQPVLDELREKFERDFHYGPRPDATRVRSPALNPPHSVGHRRGLCVHLMVGLRARSWIHRPGHFRALATGSFLASHLGMLASFDAFPECGRLAPGYQRLHCGDRCHDNLGAFGHKRRGYPACASST